jgi:hypothetical protein
MPKISDLMVGDAIGIRGADAGHEEYGRIQGVITDIQPDTITIMTGGVGEVSLEKNKINLNKAVIKKCIQSDFDRRFLSGCVMEDFEARLGRKLGRRKQKLADKEAKKISHNIVIPATQGKFQATRMDGLPTPDKLRF